MASSHVQKECETWIVQHWLPKTYGLSFAPRRMQMQGRGYFEFDAVSEDGTFVANISTASAFTHRGDVGSGKKSKIRADCLMLSLVSAKRRILLLTETTMFTLSSKERELGRLPLDIEIVRVELPQSLQQKLAAAQAVASKEVRGGA